MIDYVIRNMQNPLDNIQVDLGVDEPLWMYVKKAIQDIEKIGWYAEDAKKRWFNYSDLITQKPVTPAIYTTALLVAEEFAFDKPELLKNLVRAVIVQAMLLTTKERNIVKYCDCVNALIEAVNNTTDEDWN